VEAFDHASNGSTGASCSDDNSDTYHTDVQSADPELGALLVVCSAPSITSELASSSTITVTFTGGGTVDDALAHAFSVPGLASSPLDQTAAANGVSPSPSSGATATTTQPNELLFGAISSESLSASGAGFIAGINETANNCATTASPTYSSLGGLDVGGLAPSLFGEYCVVSATGDYTATGSINLADEGTSQPWSAAIATYKIVTAALHQNGNNQGQNGNNQGQNHR
jgi:hypothetical protein